MDYSENYSNRSVLDNIDKNIIQIHTKVRDILINTNTFLTRY